VFWTLHAYEMSQGANCRQPLIARRDTAASSIFQVMKKGANLIRREFLDAETIDGSASTTCGKRQQQAKGVTVALLGVSGQIPLSNYVFKKEAPHPRTQHGGVSHGEHSSRA
jgi:hypothetical protein